MDGATKIVVGQVAVHSFCCKATTTHGLTEIPPDIAIGHQTPLAILVLCVGYFFSQQVSTCLNTVSNRVLFQ